MTQARFQRIFRPTAALALALGLAGCMAAPMATGPRVIPAPSSAPQSDVQPSGATGAEQACIAAGRDRGLDVQGVAGSRSVTGPDGQDARDVMLRVSRSGSQIEVRCNYQTATGMARIMLI
ncbi:hypothetical protein [Roseinatronobacter alkalisoli]|uniref:Succinate dehydrogenase n=1 Tax=Roseinatronobacter alkalisoli TaxID=3028235 RepID=A0ABT5T6Q1_9RHOB|nr:hypothetical protein [Roseinatronobacter sp. HJB301]MDD7970081.1 hypothetical protein [Roseinatronobacter sp. HJB301]